MKVSVVLLSALSLVGCATTGNVVVMPEQAVRARVQGYYDAMVATDFRKAYDYLSPAYRAGASYEAFLLGRLPKAKYVSASVEKVTCEAGDSCSAEVLVWFVAKNIKGVAPAPIRTYIPEKWIKVDNQWWRVLPN